MSSSAMTLRDAHKDLTRGRILDAALAAMSAAGRGEASIADIAAAAGVTERTVYRHFATREALMEAVWRQANSRIGRPGMPQSVAELLAGPKVMFPRFDEDEALFRWFVASPEGQAVRLSVKTERQKAYLALVRQARPELDARAARRLAAVCQLLDSSFAWQSMKDYWDLDGKDAGRAASDAISHLLNARKD